MNAKIKHLIITEEALERIPEQELLQFLAHHGCEWVRSMKGDVARPERQESKAA
jgi:hypothetical protein